MEFIYFNYGMDRSDSRNSISYVKAKNMLKGLGASTIEITDGRFLLPTRQEIERLMKLNFLSNSKYIATIRDCDDYSRSLWGRAAELMGGFAICQIHCWVKKNGKTVSKHALNGFIGDDYKFYYIEPQTNTIYHFEDRTDLKPYWVVM